MTEVQKYLITDNGIAQQPCEENVQSCECFYHKPSKLDTEEFWFTSMNPHSQSDFNMKPVEIFKHHLHLSLILIGPAPDTKCCYWSGH